MIICSSIVFSISFSYIKLSISAKSDYSCCCNNLINYFNIIGCNIIPANIFISLMRIIETTTKLDSRNITISVVNFLFCPDKSKLFSYKATECAPHRYNIIDIRNRIIWNAWTENEEKKEANKNEHAAGVQTVVKKRVIR